MVEQKIDSRYMEKHSQRQGHLGASRVIRTLNHVGEVRTKKREREPSTAARRPKVQKEKREAERWPLGLVLGLKLKVN